MYKKERRSWMKHLDFTLLDILLVQIAFLISYAIRFELGWAYGALHRTNGFHTSTR